MVSTIGSLAASPLPRGSLFMAARRHHFGVPAGLDGARKRVSSGARADVVRRVAADIVAAAAHPNVLVGIDGASGTGKSTFADELASQLVSIGHLVVRASIDSFHRPRVDRYRRGIDSPRVTTSTPTTCRRYERACSRPSRRASGPSSRPCSTSRRTRCDEHGSRCAGKDRPRLRRPVPSPARARPLLGPHRVPGCRRQAGGGVAGLPRPRPAEQGNGAGGGSGGAHGKRPASPVRRGPATLLTTLRPPRACPPGHRQRRPPRPDDRRAATGVARSGVPRRRRSGDAATCSPVCAPLRPNSPGCSVKATHQNRSDRWSAGDPLLHNPIVWGREGPWFSEHGTSGRGSKGSRLSHVRTTRLRSRQCLHRCRQFGTSTGRSVTEPSLDCWRRGDSCCNAKSADET